MSLDLDYEGKRDRWNGYDVNQHKKIFEEYQKMEEVCKVFTIEMINSLIILILNFIWTCIQKCIEELDWKKNIDNS